jgi:periplasmic protein TonB
MKTNTTAIVDVGESQHSRTELKNVFHRNFVKGMIISILLHAAVIGTYYAIEYLGSEEDIPTVGVRILKYSDLGPPPSISAIPPPPSVAMASAVKPSIGVPVPVPDAEATSDQTIATQAELSATPSPALEQGNADGHVQVQQDIVIADEDPGMDAFIAVEKQPQIVKRVIPIYPDMAMRAGLEGTVWVKILVDKDGVPRKAIVIKSTAELFNESAVAAAMGFLFTPAVMNNGPVKVWVAIPFKFVLKDAGTS